MNADLKIAIVKKLERVMNNIDGDPLELLIDIRYLRNQTPKINYNIKELINEEVKPIDS